MSNVDDHYVNNKYFLNLLREHKKIEEAKKILTTKAVYDNDTKMLLLVKHQTSVKNEIGKIFLKISIGFLKKPQFMNYSRDRKEEMISDSTYFMTKYMGTFNIERDNPFAYFTRTCRNAVLQYLNKRKKQEETFESLGYIENLFYEDVGGEYEE